MWRVSGNKTVFMFWIIQKTFQSLHVATMIGDLGNQQKWLMSFGSFFNLECVQIFADSPCTSAIPSGKTTKSLNPAVSEGVTVRWVKMTGCARNGARTWLLHCSIYFRASSHSFSANYKSRGHTAGMQKKPSRATCVVNFEAVCLLTLRRIIGNKVDSCLKHAMIECSFRLQFSRAVSGLFQGWFIVRNLFRARRLVVVRYRHRQPDVPVPTLSTPPPMFVPPPLVCPPALEQMEQMIFQSNLPNFTP